MSDEDLGAALAPDQAMEIQLKLVRSLTAELRATYERMIWVGNELNAGRTPAGVIVCGDHR